METINKISKQNDYRLERMGFKKEFDVAQYETWVYDLGDGWTYEVTFEYDPEKTIVELICAEGSMTLKTRTLNHTELHELRSFIKLFMKKPVENETIKKIENEN